MTSSTIQTCFASLARRISGWAGRLFVEPADAADRWPRPELAPDNVQDACEFPSEERRLRTLANNLPHALIYQIVLLPDGLRKFTYVSQSVQRLHEVPVESVLADPQVLYRQVLPECLPSLLAAEEQAFRTLSPFHHEMACRLPSGQTRWFQLSSIPNPLSDGTLAWDGLEVDITERKLAEQAQRAGVEEFRAFFETAVVGAAQVDPETYQFIHVNDRYCQMVGYSREELRNLTFLDITHPDEREANREHFDALTRGECQDYFSQKRHVRKDGQEIWVQVSLAVIRDVQGRAIRACAVVQDITEQRQIRQRLDAALAQADHERSQLQAVLDVLPIPLFIADEHGGLVVTNPAAATVWGNAPLTRDLSSYAADHNARWAHTGQPVKPEEWGMARALSRGEVCLAEEVDIEAADGSPKTILNYALPIRESDGRITGGVAVNVDITARKAIEQALRQSEARFRAAYEHAPIGIEQLSLGGILLDVNLKISEMLGYTREELIGRDLEEITAPQDRALDADHIRRLLAGEISSYTLEKRYIHRTGTPVWVRVSSSLTGDPSDPATRRISVIEDITHDKQAEDALRRSEQRFRSLVEATAAIVWDTPASGEYVTDQPGWSAFTGQSFEQLKGWGWLEAVHPDDRTRAAEVWARAVADKTYYQDEHRLRRHDGAYRHMLARAIPILDEAGQVREWIGVHSDVEDLTQAEQSAVHAAEQHRLALEAAQLGTWDYNLATGEVLWDDRCREMFGVSSGQKIDFSRTLELIHPEDRTTLAQRVAAATGPESDGSLEFEFRVLCAGGLIHWVSARGQAIFEGEGQNRQAVRLIGTVMNTTERKRAEDALRESEEYFRTLADNIAQFAWMADEKGSLFWYNRRWYDYTGTTFDEMQGWGWQKVLHPDHVDRVSQKLKHCFEKGILWEDTFPIKAKDGNYRWFLSRAIPIHDDHGNVHRWFGTNTDITEQQDAEQRLRESRALYRSRLAELQTIYRSAPIGLCVLDRDFRYVRINDHLAEINGLAAAEHIGRTIRQVVPDVADQEEPMLRQVLETGKPITDTEVSGQTRAVPGMTRHWLVSYYPLPNDAGEIVGINITAQEITDRKRTEQQRQMLLEAEQAARAESERYNRLKDEFLATVSHELRSPLNAILGWTRLLVQGKAEAGRALEIVERNASGLAQIVEDLLDMSRIISGKVNLHRSLADLGPLASSVMESVQLAAQAKGIALHSWIDPQLRPIICDPNRIQQIIWNLLTNAVKFTPSGGQVWLRLNQLVDGINITVQDTGQGIPADFLSQIFGRFQQVDSSIARKHGGLGLGLSITKHLVELHGGTIWGASQGKDKGATFTVQLPSCQPLAPDDSDRLAEEGPRQPARMNNDDDAQSILTGISVLVVDDDPDSCELAARILRDTGATVYLADSAERGFEILMDVRPDVLISDISMPQQDGYAFVRKVRACGGWCVDLVCVALTALARPEDRTGALQAGYDEYLTKPFDATALSILVSRLTRGRQLRPGPGSYMEPEKPTSPSVDQRRTDSKRHVLLAEDNAAISEMLRLFLEGSGYAVSIAPTVKQALEIADQHPVDLLLSDFRLKDGTGWQLMESLRARGSIPGVMLSGYSDPFYIQKSKAAGFSEYLVKPVEEEQLLAVIEQALGQAHSTSRD